MNAFNRHTRRSSRIACAMDVIGVATSLFRFFIVVHSLWKKQLAS